MAAFEPNDQDLPDCLDGWMEGDIGIIHGIDVPAELRGTGIGRRLVKAFEEWAAVRGASSIEGVAMPSSVGFWERLGYELAEDDEDGYFAMRRSILSPAASSRC